MMLGIGRWGRAIAVAMLVPASAAGQAPDGYAWREADGAQPGTVLAQPARISVDDLSLVEALTLLNRMSGVPVSFSPSRVPANVRVSCECEAVSVGEALDHLLSGTRLHYRVVDDHVLILDGPRVRPADMGPRLASLRPSTSTLEAGPPSVAPGTVVGQVTDAATDRPLAGLSVTLEGTRRGVISRPDGSFILTNVPAGTHRVRVSLIGYAPAVERVTVTSGSTAMVQLAMRAQAVVLDEVMAIGYGTQRRRQVTGAMTSVSSEELSRAPIATLEHGLQGRAPGVHVISSSGQPGAVAAVRIRGGNSITASNDPLYVLDGVPINVNTADTNAGGLLGGGTMVGNPLGTLTPGDIESIQILMDASATAIYGARAANGVVLITTKRGRPGQNAVSFATYFGRQQVRRTLPLLDAQQFARLVNEAYRNNGHADLFSESQIAAYGAGTDWQREIFRVAPVQNHDLSVAGGSEATRFFASGNLFRSHGVVAGSQFSRNAFRLNLDHNLSDRLRIGNRLSFSRTDADITANAGASSETASVVLAALRAPPILRPYSEFGEFFSGTDPVTGRPFHNPVAIALATTNNETQNRFLGNAFGELDLLEGLTARASVGLDYINSNQKFYSPRIVMPGAISNGQARRGTAVNFNWLSENTLSYDRRLGAAHDLQLLGGLTLERSTTEITGLEARDFTTDQLGPDAIGTGALRQNMYSEARDWTLLSYLSRAQLGLSDSRYILTLTGRIDGSSRFGAGNRYSFFPSLGAAWRLSDEPWLRDLNLFNDLKLRGSVGRTGNQAVAPYQSLARLQSVGYVIGGERVVGFVPATMANPDLRWETTDQYNLGLDMAFFGNRLAITADAYWKRTNDLLLWMQIPQTTGSTNMLSNVGSVRNRGAELSIVTVNLQGRVGWTTELNLGSNRNRVIDLGDDEQIINPLVVGVGAVQNPTILRVGEPLNSFYGYRFAGLDGDGRPTFEDVNGSGTVTSEDKVILGNAQPDFTGGMTNRLTFGNFDLSLFVQWSIGNDVYNINRSLLTNTQGAGNQLTDVIEGARGVPRPRVDNTFNNWESDLFIEDGSYIRGKNLRLGYTLPAGRARGLPILGDFGSMSVYLSAQNFFTITSYSGFDPEISEYSGSNTAQGIDFGSYPQTRQFTIGINVGT